MTPVQTAYYHSTLKWSCGKPSPDELILAVFQSFCSLCTLESGHLVLRYFFGYVKTNSKRVRGYEGLMLSIDMSRCPTILALDVPLAIADHQSILTYYRYLILCHGLTVHPRQSSHSYYISFSNHPHSRSLPKSGNQLTLHSQRA